jgi:esterase/lipase superfamily enzyme
MRRETLKVKKYLSCTSLSWNCSVLVILIAVVLLPLISAAEESKELVIDDPTTERDEAKVNVTIFFATNRRQYGGESATNTFSGERGEPHYGYCRVEFSPIPIINQFGSKVPFYVPKETNQISIVKQADQQLFWEDLVTAAAQTTSQSVIVFVHGYNYGFNRTCRMAAELQRPLLGKSTVIMMSWPSNAKPTDYLPDQVDLEWSVPFLASFLSKIADRIGPSSLQVLAHSMGSRGVLFALDRLGANSQKRPVINNLVLLAPDFDSETFVDLLPRLIPLASSITLYASRNDTPLKVSRQLNGHPRLGEAGEFLTVVDGIETIDVSPVGRYQILGHEYFYFHPRVAADLVLLLSSGARAAERPTLRSKRRDGGSYWEIVEDASP